MKRLIMLSVLIVISLTFLVSQDSTRSLAQQSESSRDPQLLRNIYNEGNPERVWLQVEQKPASPDTNFTQSTNPPSWAIYTFQSYRDDKWNIYTLKPDGTEAKLYTGEGLSLYPMLKKNGSQIVFVSNWPNNYEIYAIASNGSDLRRITSDSATDTHPTWSPDGNWIAFQTYRSGNSDIWIMDGNGNGTVAITDSPFYDGEPSWSPMGSKSFLYPIGAALMNYG